MTDDERIAQLMELARKVWPEGGEDFACEVEYDGIGYSIQDEAGFTVLLVRNHPLALDALEAALLVLANADRLSDEEREYVENMRRRRDFRLRIDIATIDRLAPKPSEGT